MLTLKQIIQRTAGRRKESAKYVRILQVKKGWDSLGRGYVASASYSTHIWNPLKQKFVKNTTGPNRKPRRYVTVIVFLDPRLHVISSCSCADFKYRWEVALNRKQAAEIEYSNGELPVIRNPSMRAAQCKHLIALYWKIEDQLPKPKKNDQSAPIKPPEIGVPPSQQQKLVKPVVVKKPVNVQRSVKPGKKQSTAPRAKPPAKITTPPVKPARKPDVMKPAPRSKSSKPVTPPARMTTKPKPAPSKSGPARITPKAKPAAPKAAPKKVAPPVPAMRAKQAPPAAKPAAKPTTRGPAMMRAK
jgi:hypothetical protein